MCNIKCAPQLLSFFCAKRKNCNVMFVVAHPFLSSQYNPLIVRGKRHQTVIEIMRLISTDPITNCMQCGNKTGAAVIPEQSRCGNNLQEAVNYCAQGDAMRSLREECMNGHSGAFDTTSSFFGASCLFRAMPIPFYTGR
ncbi:hypothetical protein ACU10_05505 [Xanthomonas oryzae pv. oryzicola]|nr:hypothetical protein ACU13_05525 [Xanthomonas oryzae pv. oryzicola]AKN96314.1 hypothetical protein ACU10_05505 [Xanthomonas oryzae pv. oryzicola]AKO11531.1 hypothetical protein ACU14_05480 [Xanthomonas oryzae pv. oryzicola]AKO15274.1 hypothetical protein ACU12_05520 [Xanthomonas oryzae pv. oryzicola]